MKGYSYVGTHYDVQGREIGIFDKKYGITKTPEIRERNLTATKSPIQFMNIRLWQFESELIARNVEQVVHKTLKYRNTFGEWFKDDDEDLISIVESIHTNLTNLGVKITPIDITPKLQVESGFTSEEKIVMDNTIKKAKTSLKLTINGEDRTAETGAKTLVNAYVYAASKVGWEKIDKDETIVTKNFSEFQERYKFKFNFQTHEDYFIYTGLGNGDKHRVIQSLIQRYSLSEMNSYYEYDI
jgi:hypothetical protein